MAERSHSDPTLRRWYRQFNRQYFGDTLPPSDDVVLCWEPVAHCDGECAKVHEAGTDRETGDFIIRIDPAYRMSKNVARLVLIHEMVHVKLWPYVAHGTRFDRELARLCMFPAYRRLL